MSKLWQETAGVGLFGAVSHVVNLAGTLKIRKIILIKDYGLIVSKLSRFVASEQLNKQGFLLFVI
jgi:hypothetical protein